MSWMGPVNYTKLVYGVNAKHFRLPMDSAFIFNVISNVPFQIFPTAGGLICSSIKRHENSWCLPCVIPCVSLYASSLILRSEEPMGTIVVWCSNDHGTAHEVTDQLMQRRVICELELDAPSNFCFACEHGYSFVTRLDENHSTACIKVPNRSKLLAKDRVIDWTAPQLVGLSYGPAACELARAKSFELLNEVKRHRFKYLHICRWLS